MTQLLDDSERRQQFPHQQFWHVVGGRFPLLGRHEPMIWSTTTTITTGKHYHHHYFQQQQPLVEFPLMDANAFRVNERQFPIHTKERPSQSKNNNKQHISKHFTNKSMTPLESSEQTVYLQQQQQQQHMDQDTLLREIQVQMPIFDHNNTECVQNSRQNKAKQMKENLTASIDTLGLYEGLALTKIQQTINIKSQQQNETQNVQNFVDNYESLTSTITTGEKQPVAELQQQQKYIDEFKREHTPSNNMLMAMVANPTTTITTTRALAEIENTKKENTAQQLNETTTTTTTTTTSSSGRNSDGRDTSSQQVRALQQLVIVADLSTGTSSNIGQTFVTTNTTTKIATTTTTEGSKDIDKSSKLLASCVDDDGGNSFVLKTINENKNNKSNQQIDKPQITITRSKSNGAYEMVVSKTSREPDEQIAEEEQFGVLRVTFDDSVEPTNDEMKYEMRSNLNNNLPASKTFISPAASTTTTTTTTTTKTTKTTMASTLHSQSLDAIGVNLDSVLPERTRLRRQRRMLSQSSQDKTEDPVERLNRLRARISGALSQVKGVLKQYSVDGATETKESTNTVTNDITLQSQEHKEQQEQPDTTDNGPIQFRFVRKVRRRSVFNVAEEDEEEKKKMQQDQIAVKDTITVSNIQKKCENEAKNSELEVKQETESDVGMQEIVKKDIRETKIDVGKEIDKEAEKETETVVRKEAERKVNQKTESEAEVEKKVSPEFKEKVGKEIVKNEQKTVKILLEEDATTTKTLLKEEIEASRQDQHLKKRNVLLVKPKGYGRRASIAAVERSKIEPPIKAPLVQGFKAQRRPSDSEAILKKKVVFSKASNGENKLPKIEHKVKQTKVNEIATTTIIGSETDNNKNNNHINSDSFKKENNQIVMRDDENSNKDAALIAVINNDAARTSTKVHERCNAAGKVTVAQLISPLQDSETSGQLQAQREKSIESIEQAIGLLESEASASVSASVSPAAATSEASTTKVSDELPAANSIAEPADTVTSTTAIIMPEFQALLAPVQVFASEIKQSDPPFNVPKDEFAKKHVVLKKLMRKNSHDKLASSKKAPSIAEPEPQTDKKPEADPQPDQEEEVVLIEKPRKVKKKVIIKRQQRRLSVSDTGFFREPAASEHNEPFDDVETLEKTIAYVTDDDDEDINNQKKAATNENLEENAAEDLEITPSLPPPLKTCLKLREFEVGDWVMYAERYKKTLVRWKKGLVIERITSISYKLDIDGKEVPAHISYIKKYTDRKVNFGGKEYLEINYEQLEEEEKAAHSYSIWNMV